MKKDKTLHKLTIFYDKFVLSVYLLCFIVSIIACCIVYLYHLGPDTTWGRIQFTKLLLFPPCLFPVVLFFLRRRTIDAKGIYASFLGIKYKQIYWENVLSYQVKNLIPKCRNKNRPDQAKDMIIFTALPGKKGKSTIIMMDASPEAIALVEKYFPKTTGN